MNAAALRLASRCLLFKKVYSVEYNRTMFGVHVPHRIDSALTETYLLTFRNRQDAKDFAIELSRMKTENGEWPSRVIKQPNERGLMLRCKTPLENKEFYRKAARAEGLHIRENDRMSLLRLCALTGILLRIARRLRNGEGFVFEHANDLSFYRVKKEQVINFLFQMMKKC